MKINKADWDFVPVEQLFYVKGRIGWRGLKRSMFTDHGPYLITGMHIIDGKIQWDECFHIPEHKYLESPEIMVQEGDMVITKDGTIGKVGFIDWLPGPTSLNSHLFLVRPKIDDVARRFAYHVFTSQLFEDFIEQQRSGSTLSGLSETKFLKFNFPLPEIDEQKRIADILDTADAAIQQTEQLIAKLKQVKAGLLHDLLTRGLDEHGNLRDPDAHPEQFKMVDGYGRVPKDWTLTTLVDEISLPSGQLDPKLEPYSNLPLIAPDHIESNSGRLLEIKTAKEQNAISGKYGFQPGDVLYSKIRPYLRKAVLVKFEGLCSADMYPLRSGPNLDSRFLFAIILGEHFSRFAESVSMRSGFPKINRNELAEYQMFLPSIEEQQGIADILDAHNGRIHAEEAYRDKLQAIKQGLMHDLLTGKVRV